MQQKTMILALAFSLLCLPQTLVAASHETHKHHSEPGSEHAQHLETNNPNEIHLSPDLMALLNQEMRLIQKGMMEIVPAIAAGKWDDISSIGQKIKASFILKQKLTKTQKDELHRVLPQHFIEMDMDFHKSAGMLAHAAEMRNADVVNFYFFKMNTACVSCHGRYATERFPGLAKGGHAEHQH